VRTIVEPLPHDLAVVDALETIGKPVGFAQAPANALNSSGLPVQDYITLYPIGGGRRDGTIDDPYGEAQLVYQTTIVGRLPDGVRWIAGQIEEALLGVTVAGRSVIQVVPEDLEGVFADRDVGPPHPFYSTPRWRIWTVPA
jgi:hypothetical protein